MEEGEAEMSEKLRRSASPSTWCRVPPVGIEGGTDPFAGVDWESLLAEVVRLGRSLLSPADAEDMATAGIERLLAGESPWDPNGRVTLARHVFRVGMNVRRAERRKLQRRRRPDFEAKQAIAMAENMESPEEDYAEVEAKTRMYGMLLSACADDPEALRILDAEREGVIGVVPQMQHCKLDETAVRNGRDRIGRRLRAIVEQERKAEEDSS
jgi:hypothetical protein